MSLFVELKRRNVFRVATAYLVVGWLLIEVATTLLPTFGAPEWVTKALIFFFALAFIPIILFSWAFELTPEGIKLEKDVERDNSITSDTGKKLSYVTIAAVVVGVGFLAWDKTGSGPIELADEVVAMTGSPSVAVLPFVNMSGNADNEYFSDGLTETLLHMLAQIPDLRVAARTSSFAFKGQDSDVREIAAALDVAHILEGSVQRAGDRVRITAQLIRADDGFHVWSENYDRTLDDIFGIQDEIADKVGSALSASLLGTKEPTHRMSVGTENLEAYDLYLRSLAQRAKGSYGALILAEGMLKDALALDPEFYAAKTELAKGYLLQWETGLLEGDAPIDDALALAEQVLLAQPDDVDAQTVIYEAEINILTSRSDIAAAQSSLNLLQAHAKANPNSIEATKAMASWLRRFFREEEALVYQLALVELDPLNPEIFYDLAVTYRNLERQDESREAVSRSLELEPSNPSAQTTLAWIDRSEGDAVGFLRNYLKAMEIDPKDHELPGNIAMFLYELGLPDEADAFRSRVLAIAPSSPVAYSLNVLHASRTGDMVGMRVAARRAIVEDIDDRMGGYGDAIDALIWDAIQNDTLEETIAWLGETVPGVADFSANVDIKYVFARFPVLRGWEIVLPRDEVKRRYEIMFDFVRSLGFDPDERPEATALMAVLNGDTEAGIRILADEFFAEEPVLDKPYWERMLTHPTYADVVIDPRIEAHAKRWREETERARENVKAFLSSPGA